MQSPIRSYTFHGCTLVKEAPRQWQVFCPAGKWDGSTDNEVSARIRAIQLAGIGSRDVADCHPVDLTEAERGFLYTLLSAEHSITVQDLRKIGHPNSAPAAWDLAERHQILLESLLAKLAKYPL